MRSYVARMAPETCRWPRSHRRITPWYSLWSRKSSTASRMDGVRSVRTAFRGPRRRGGQEAPDATLPRCRSLGDALENHVLDMSSERGGPYRIRSGDRPLMRVEEPTRAAAAPSVTRFQQVLADQVDLRVATDDDQKCPRRRREPQGRRSLVHIGSRSSGVGTRACFAMNPSIAVYAPSPFFSPPFGKLGPPASRHGEQMASSCPSDPGAMACCPTVHRRAPIPARRP